MNIFFIDAIFFIFTIFILIKICSYAFYEMRNENNVFGGVTTIVVTLVSVIFVNVMVWIN